MPKKFLVVLFCSIMVAACAQQPAEQLSQPSQTLRPYHSATPSPSTSPLPFTPAPLATEKATATPWVHIVSANDTLSGIAARYGVSLADLLAANPELDPQFLSLDMEVRIPIEGTGLQEALSATATPLPLHAANPACYAVFGGEIWCISSIENQTDDTAAYLGSARTQLQTDDSILPTAVQLALDIDPLLSDAYLFAAQYYSSNRHLENAEVVLKDAIEAGASSPQIMIELSEAEFLLNKYDTALEYAIQGSADDPGSLKGYLVLGRAFAAVGSYYDAIPPLQTYLAYMSEDHRAWGALGTSLLQTGDPEGALEAFNIALSFRDYAPAYQGRADIEYSRGEFSAALSDYFRARQYGPDSDRLALNIGKTYYQLESMRDALKELNNLVASTQDRVILSEAYTFLGLIYEAIDSPADAIVYWTYVMSIPEARADLVSLADEHLRNLQGDNYQSPTPRAALSATFTPEIPPAVTAQATATPTITPTPAPVATATPRPTAPPRGIVP